MATSAVSRPRGPVAPAADDLRRYLRQMVLIRRFEEKAGEAYSLGKIGGFCHLYIGQEAVVVGLESTAKEGDQRVTTYRDHGHMLACGMDPRGVMAELTGRSGGYSKGKGGSMHMFSKEKDFYGGHGIVGDRAGISICVAILTSLRRTRQSRARPRPAPGSPGRTSPPR